MKKVSKLLFLVLCLMTVAILIPQNVYAAEMNEEVVEEINLTDLYYTIQSEEDLSHEEVILEMHSILFDENNISKSSYPGGVNEEEFWIIVLNLWPWEYNKAKNVKDAAVEKTTLYYGDNSWRDDGDAFRHTYFAALLSLEFGGTFAKNLTDAHESLAEPGLDKDMDLHNNARGIALYAIWKENYKVGNDNLWNQLAEYITHAVRFGQFYNIIKLNDVQNPQFNVFTGLGQGNLRKYPISNFIQNKLTPGQYGFESQYFFYTKTKTVTAGNLNIQTERLRTGFIENQYIVMSPMRENAGAAYLTYSFSQPIKMVDMDLMFWSGIEGINNINGTATLEYKNNQGQWIVFADLLNGLDLSTRYNPKYYDFVFETPVQEIRFNVNVSNPYGDRNKGRICIGEMNFYYW